MHVSYTQRAQILENIYTCIYSHSYQTKQKLIILLSCYFIAFYYEGWVLEICTIINEIYLIYVNTFIVYTINNFDNATRYSIQYSSGNHVRKEVISRDQCTFNESGRTGTAHMLNPLDVEVDLEAEVSLSRFHYWCPGLIYMLILGVYFSLTWWSSVEMCPMLQIPS